MGAWRLSLPHSAATGTLTFRNLGLAQMYAKVREGNDVSTWPID
jgi:hypothetical protein